MKKRERRQRVVRSYEAVNQYRGQHDELDVEQIDPNDVRARRVRVLRPNRLRKYLALRSISQPMCDAGELLATHWERAGLTPRVTANYSIGYAAVHTSVNLSGGLSTEAVDHRAEVRKALSGDRARYADLLVSVCCFDEGLRDTRRLRRALTRLAVHFGFLRRNPQFGR